MKPHILQCQTPTKQSLLCRISQFTCDFADERISGFMPEAAPHPAAKEAAFLGKKPASCVTLTLLHTTSLQSYANNQGKRGSQNLAPQNQLADDKEILSLRDLFRLCVSNLQRPREPYRNRVPRPRWTWLQLTATQLLLKTQA